MGSVVTWAKDSTRGCSQYNICRGEKNYACFFSSHFDSHLELEDFVGDTSGTEEDTDSAILYGTLGSVVGLQYYAGIVNNNEMVALQREPCHPSDKIAVKVNSFNGDQVGHIKKELAAVLAGIMDNKLALVGRVVPHGAKNAFTMPVQMRFWGREENKEAVLDQLKKHGFKHTPLKDFSSVMEPGVSNVEKFETSLRYSSCLPKRDKAKKPRYSGSSNFREYEECLLLRIVLDEKHTIRNPNAQQTKAALSLEGVRRWVVTGTPIQNSVEDLWCLISFLKLKPFTDGEWWHRTIQRLVTMGTSGGLGRLQSLMRNITLRTKTSKLKGKPILELPEHKVLIQHVEEICIMAFRLVAMLAVNCLFSRRGNYNETPGELRETLVFIGGSKGQIRSCFCRYDKAKCPLCRNELAQQLVECSLEEEVDSSSGKKSDQEWISSSKINALMHALIELRRDNPAAKCLVISQFTTFLLLVENPLKDSGFAFTRLDGSVTRKKRVEAIQCFQGSQAGSPAVMLLSLKAGGVGLNLTAASQVFLMDPVSWNPAAEDQCFDRCHRLGEKSKVVITKFIVKDSVEENMLKIQNKKRELAAGAFATKKPSSSEGNQAKINEMRGLIDLYLEMVVF
ncbi:LOW QUALITY PROTEIN: helicase-like transcription factor [Phaethornis superciliosus]